MHPEQPLEEDNEDNEENWIVGGCRDPDDLKAHGFQPVWTGWGGYPGEIPSEIAEWLDDTGNRGE